MFGRTVFCAASCVALASAAQADIVQFRFEGSITAATGNFNGTPFAGVQSGANYILTYSFQSNTPDSIPDPTLGQYDSALTSINLQIGAGTSTSLSSGDIEIADNFANAFDAYQLDVGLGNGLEMGLLLQDFTRTVFSSDALPTNLNLNGFSNRLFTLTGPNGSMTGSVTGFALPAPGTAAALAACAVLGFRRRRN
jgi:hypothetical protein